MYDSKAKRLLYIRSWCFIKLGHILRPIALDARAELEKIGPVAIAVSQGAIREKAIPHLLWKGTHRTVTVSPLSFLYHKQQPLMFTIKRAIPLSRQIRLVGFRHQSSSSSAKFALEEKQEVQDELLKKNQNTIQEGETSKNISKGEKSELSTSSLSSQMERPTPAKLRKGFSNVAKVPSTLNVETKDILLDKLYQGYNPLLSPIKPKPKKTAPKILVNIYEDIAFDEDGFEEEDVVDSMLGPKLHVSRYIYDKDPAIEAKLKDLDKNVEDEVKNTKTLALKKTVTFVDRENKNSKRGRTRLQFKKKINNKSDE